MSKRPGNEDQLANFESEIRDGTWAKNARQRAARRKSAWNLLLPLIGFPAWMALALLLVKAGYLLRSVFTHHSGLGLPRGAMDLPAFLILLPSLICTVAPALLLTNFLVYLVPPARRAMDREDAPYPSVGYAASQAALGKMTGWSLLAWLVPVAVAAMLR